MDAYWRNKSMTLNKLFAPLSGRGRRTGGVEGEEEWGAAGQQEDEIGECGGRDRQRCANAPDIPASHENSTVGVPKAIEG